MAKRKAKSALVAQASAAASTDMSERTRGAKKANELNERALHLLRAADEAEREGHIAGMAEAAAICLPLGEERSGFRDGAVACKAEILAELRRRYKDHPDRIEHHLRLRGLA